MHCSYENGFLGSKLLAEFKVGQNLYNGPLICSTLSSGMSSNSVCFEQ